MADYSSRLKMHRAYRVTKDTISTLVSVIGPFIASDPTITFYLEGSHEIKDSNLNALLEDPYIGAKYIDKLSIDGRSHAESGIWRTVDVTFEVGTLQTVVVSISGERKESTALRSEVENILKGAELWYSFMFLPYGFASFLISTIGPFIVILSGTFVAAMLLGYEQNGKFPPSVGLVCICLLALFYGLKRLLFPKLTFEIGKSANLVRYSGYWLNFVFVTIIVGFLAKYAFDHLLVR